jgi:hypothetical protein
MSTMQWDDFIIWLRARGVMRMIPGLFANVDEIDVWADDDDGHRPLTDTQKDGSISNPLFCFAARDAAGRLQLLVVEALDPQDMPFNGIDYRTWEEVVMERLAPHRMRITLGRAESGHAGELAAWLERKGLTLQDG